jgi:D-threo-aldose 1-dehydrogenase
MTMADLPRLGLGCAPLGNLGTVFTEDQADEVLEAAWEAGVRHFDTAPHYGLGLSEHRLGRFLAGKPRAEYVVSTKVGRLLRDNPDWDGVSTDDNIFVVPARLRRVLDYTAAGVRASLEDSLERMGLDRVDLLYVHDPEHAGVDGAAESAMAGLAQLREAGLVSSIGTGSLSVDSLLRAVRTGLADVVMAANCYTLLKQTVAPDLLAACEEHGTRIVAAAVFNSGVLASTPSKASTFDYVAVPDDVLAQARAIDAVCQSYDVELAAAAIQYPLLDPRVGAVMVGAASPEQVRQNAARFDVPIPDALWTELDERGLVPQVVAECA